MKRLFLAVPVTLFDYKNLKNDFEDVLQGRWVPEQNLHLTLQFFADKYTQDFLVERISALDLRTGTSELKGLSLLTRGNILYAQTQDNTSTVVHTQIQEALMLSEEEAFIPHVTLMRIKRVLNQELFEERLRAYERKSIGLVHDKIQLIQSIVTPAGAEYTLLKEF